MSPLVAAPAGGASTIAGAAAAAAGSDGSAAPLVSLVTPFASATGPPESAPQSLMGFSVQQQQQPPQQQQQHQSSAPVPQSSPFAALAQASQPQLTASSSLEQLLAGQCKARHLAFVVQSTYRAPLTWPPAEQFIQSTHQGKQTTQIHDVNELL
jgi:hypothetical protein